MKINSTKFTGLSEFTRDDFCDERGYFGRVYCKRIFKKLGFSSACQMNLSLTKRLGCIRGLHFQYPPYQEGKIITCLKGKVFDVVVDIRKGSNTFLEYHSVILSSKNKKGIVVPPGFAHGFQVLEQDSLLLYIHSEFYQSQNEGGINFLDKKLDIKWPETISQISEKDRKIENITSNFEGIYFNEM